MAFLAVFLVFCHLTVTYSIRVLITGGAGFIGFHVGLKLVEDKDNEVVVLDIFDGSYDLELKNARAAILKKAGVTVHSGDVCSRQMLDHLFEKHDFSAVIHMAGKHGDAESMKDPISFVTANTECLLRLLDTLKEHNNVHLVYASSHSVYGVGAELPASVQSTVGPPTSVFTALKKGMEELVESYCNKYQVSGIGLRLFNVYGPWGRPDGDIYRMALEIRDEKSVKVYKNQQDSVASRDYTFVSDVVNGVLLAMNRQPEKCGEIYNIGSGAEPVSMETVFSLLKEEMGKDAEMRYIDIPISEPLVTHGDIALTTSILDYQPRVHIEEGIKRFTVWFKEYYEERKWSSESPKPDDSLDRGLYKKRIDYVNKKYHERLAKWRSRYQDYAEKNDIPVTKFYRTKEFLKFPGKAPKTHPQRAYKDHKSKEELETLCQYIDECVAFTTDGRMYSYIGEEKEWKTSSGTTLYVADMDVCQAGFTTCFGNCTCTSVGPSQFKSGCAKGFGVVNNAEKYICVELYSPNRPTAKEEEYKILDKIEGRDWNSFIKGAEYVHLPKTYVRLGAIAYYPDAAGDVSRLKAACDDTYHCLGFTTNGELKGLIDDKLWEPSSPYDFYVKDVDYCSIGILNCGCSRRKPGVYWCNNHKSKTKL